MKNSLTKAMRASISDVLEKMFYMAIEIIETENFYEEKFQCNTPEYCLCRLSFSGPFSGNFYASCPRKLLNVLSINFLGIDESEVNEPQTLGVLKEMTNIIAGNLFTKLDVNTEYKLGIPELIDSDFDFESLDKDNKINLYIETMESILKFTIETK